MREYTYSLYSPYMYTVFNNSLLTPSKIHDPGAFNAYLFHCITDTLVNAVWAPRHFPTGFGAEIANPTSSPESVAGDLNLFHGMCAGSLTDRPVVVRDMEVGGVASAQ